VDPRKIGRVLHGGPVCGVNQVTAEQGTRMLATVGTRGARDQVRGWAVGAGFSEGQDFLCVT
ncbi:MAG: glycosyl transferase, partial [Geobacteraceae bacterium]|nr:glycosyl transferase [Geobacteraceae bacterium]